MPKFDVYLLAAITDEFENIMRKLFMPFSMSTIDKW